MKKYGRTHHLPTSPGVSSDDKVLQSIDGLTGDDIVVTEKMDGENTTIHWRGTYARSPDSRYHPSRDWLKAFAASVSPQLGENERVVGENLFARHSIGYDRLPSYFLGFAWIIDDVIQSWDDSMVRFRALGIVPVPLLYRGPYRPGLFDRLTASLDLHHQEGFVVRIADAFPESLMQSRMGKYVRQGHVESEEHWMTSPMVKNRLA